MSFQPYAALAGLVCIAGGAADAAAQEATASAALSLKDAVARALSTDPGLNAAAAARQAAEASLKQAGRFNNPTLDIVQENVAGTGLYEGWDRAETTYTLRQPLELGGERSARRALARGEIKEADAGADIRKLDLILEIEEAFIDAQAAALSLKLAEERLAVARELTTAVDRRVQAARDPLLAGARAQTRLAEAQIDADHARRAFAFSKEQLASYWGGAVDFDVDLAGFEHLANAQPVEPLGTASPDLALAEAKSARADAQVKYERAQSVPNVDVHAGFRDFNDSNESAFVFGLSIPLQIWDRNGSAIARARAQSLQASYERAAQERTIQRQKATQTAQMDIARLEVEALDARVLPSSQEALQRARDGYAMGGFSYIDVLEAQRVLSDAQQRRVSALRAYHRAAASLARLSGARADFNFSQDEVR